MKNTINNKYFKINVWKLNYNGFTLIELIVVITIISILWIIAFIALQWYSSKSRDSARISDMWKILTWLELFKLESWYYPYPTGKEDITYDSSIAWYQWYFWESVFANINNLDRIPVDPKTGLQYVYSVTNTRQENQLSWLMESDEITLFYNEKLKTIASEKTAILKTRWNYNWKVLKVNLPTTECILAIPSIISSSWTTVEQIVPNNYLWYNWYKNLPFQYYWIFKTIWEENLKLVDDYEAYCTWSLIKVLSYTNQLWKNEREKLITNLQIAYSWSIIKSVWEIWEIIHTRNKDILAKAIINNLLWWSVGTTISNWSSSSPTPTYSSCNVTETQWITYNTVTYTHNTLNHLETKTWIATSSISNWEENYTANISCNNWVISISNENLTINCDTNYVLDWWLCVLNQCNWSIPTNWLSNATSQDIWTSWTYNTTPWLCTYTYQDWYHTEDWWNTFISNTRETNCSWTIPNNATATTPITFEQTWNTSTEEREPSTWVWWENHTYCDFDCNTNYAWNWTSCEEIINWTCGSADWVDTDTAPTINLCSTWTPTSVTTNTWDYTWSCTWESWWTTASCSADRQYTVTFDGNLWWTPSPETKLVTYNTAVWTLATVSRSWYDFDWWFTATTWWSQINTSTVITWDITYYAQWTSQSPVSWSCWTSDSKSRVNEPSTNLCSAWTPTSVTTWASTYTWSCTWSGWWTTDSCSANILKTPTETTHYPDSLYIVWKWQNWWWSPTKYEFSYAGTTRYDVWLNTEALDQGLSCNTAYSRLIRACDDIWDCTTDLTINETTESCTCTKTWTEAQNDKANGYPVQVWCEITWYPWTSIPWTSVYIAWMSWSDIMVVSRNDVWQATYWCYWTTTNAISTTNGTANTTSILGSCWISNIAADLCRDIWTSWYLPSENELNDIYIYRTALSWFENSGTYLSSTEVSSNSARTIDWSSGTWWTVTKDTTYYVRCASKY